MFKLARIKLTAWYLLIIMFISISFSLVMYQELAFELNRVERMHRLRIEDRLFEPDLRLDPDLLLETKNRLALFLIIINLLIFGGSATAGYFLSGKTLKPIKEMVDEQNHFIADASHELKTPLTALKAEIEVNLRNKKLTLPQAKILLKSNLEETNKLQNLSENLLKLSQNPNLKKEIVDLKPISQEAVRKIKSFAEVKQIKIINQVNGTVRGNKTALTELLVIFLDNSIKYSQSQTKIWLQSIIQGKNLVISIKDQGIGISQKDLPYLFTRFYRADQSRSKNSAGGYGLGLAIAKKIMDQHNGIIKVDSKINQGTTFKLFLSLA